MAKKQETAILPPQPPKELPPLQKAAFLQRDKSEPKTPIDLTKRVPVDVLEHLRKRKCSEHHSDWDEKKVIYSIDHHSYILYCKTCDEHYVMPIGGIVGLPGASGVVEAATQK